MKLNTFTFKDGRKLEIHSDDDPMNPRTEFDNLSTMAFFHKRYNLGDQDHGIDHTEFGGWNEMGEYIVRKLNGVLCYPVRMYDHSGIGFSADFDGRGFGYPYNCPWDSGLVGFMFVTKAKLIKEYGDDSDESKAKAIKVMASELETYNQYHAGDVCGFILRDKPCEHCDVEAGDEIDSCWGFWGSDVKENGILDHLDDQYRDEILEGKATEVSGGAEISPFRVLNFSILEVS